MKKLKHFLLLFVFQMTWLSAAQAGGIMESLKTLPVQDGGRIKPFDTFARESLHLVYGKKNYKTAEGGKRSPVDVIVTWMLIPDYWQTQKVIEIRHNGLREALKLESKEVHYTPEKILSNERLSLLFQDLKTKRDTGDKLNPYYQAIQRLQNQITVFHMIRTGVGVRVAPNPDPAKDTWLSIAELSGDTANQFAGITRAISAAIASDQSGTSKEGSQNVKKAVESFMGHLRQQFPGRYGEFPKVSVEVTYNKIHPFMWAWIAYLLSALFMVAHIVSSRNFQYKASWGFLVVGFLLHTVGMAVRSYLTGRPPVSNMYETVVWVPWGTVMFAMILERTQKWKTLLPASSAVAVLCLILTDVAPSVLDDTLQPLEPVLRSTFWLTTHVLIITISYAAFFLAFALGDLLMFYYLKDEKKYAKQINDGVRSIYRCIQIGVVLLAAGIILGGVWADYSWGRFWGWDPKETWALIALLGYVAVLHGRLVGWIRPFGMAASAIVSFSLVIMAWYGVNFVLGAGLHSYGFGAGGVEYVSAFVAAHLLFVAFVATVRQSRMAEAKK